MISFEKSGLPAKRNRWLPVGSVSSRLLRSGDFIDDPPRDGTTFATLCGAIFPRQLDQPLRVECVAGIDSGCDPRPCVFVLFGRNTFQQGDSPVAEFFVLDVGAVNVLQDADHVDTEDIRFVLSDPLGVLLPGSVWLRTSRATLRYGTGGSPPGGYGRPAVARKRNHAARETRPVARCAAAEGCPVGYWPFSMPKGLSVRCRIVHGSRRSRRAGDGCNRPAERCRAVPRCRTAGLRSEAANVFPEAPSYK